MMKRLFPLLAVFTLLASPASALKMSIWDREMQTTLGAGESSGSRFNVQLIRNFSGPVIVIFSQTEDEKKSNAFAGLQNRYDGVLKNGQLTLMSEPADKQDGKPAPAAASSAQPGNGNSQAAQASSAAKAVGLTLNKLLQQFKLTVTVQTTSQATPAKDNPPAISGSGNPPSGNNAGGNGNGNLKSLDLKGK